VPGEIWAVQGVPPMVNIRRMVVYIATSADGYIARLDGDVGWLDRARLKDNYGYGEFFENIDTILCGRKTYDKGVDMGMKSGAFGHQVKYYVFSRQRRGSLIPGFEWASEPIRAVAQRLRGQPGKDIWMMGSGGIIASFLDEGEVDELRIHLMPILIGEGIPLIQPRHRSVRLKLLPSKAYPYGVVYLNYHVKDRS